LSSFTATGAVNVAAAACSRANNITIFINVGTKTPDVSCLRKRSVNSHSWRGDHCGGCLPVRAITCMHAWHVM
jgi:hypothetical protein